MKRMQLRRRKHFGTEQLEPRDLLAADVHDGVVGRIVGGQDAESKYGWVASLQDGFGHFCGGTLISPTAVVTAAHCIDGVASTGLSVVVGRNDLRQADGQRINVDRIIAHPQYDPFTNDADIAILRLASPATEQPIGFLSESNLGLASPGTDSLVLGWGATNEGGPTTTVLQTVQMPIVSNDTANEPVSYDGDITANMLAAGRARGGIDSCQGDSGGPLVVFDGAEQPLLTGVVSWGEGCARPNKYGIYARVSRFATWIAENAETDSPRGTVNFSPSRYLAGSTASITVEDSDIVDRDWIEVVVASESGDVEKVRLESFARGRFRGEIQLTTGVSTANNGSLETNGAETITATYLDADDGTGNPQSVSATAAVVVDDFVDNTAEATSLNAGEFVVGEIDVSGDKDWFKLDIPADGGFEIEIDLSDGTLDDSVLSLFAEDGETLLAIDDDGGRGLGSHLQYFATTPRTVYVEVAGYGVNIGSYAITVEETTFENDDHFNVFSLATNLEVGETSEGNINYPSDEDWFQFEAEAGVLYQARVDLQQLSDSQLRLVNTNGRNELQFNDDRTSDDLSSRLFFFVDESGTYYLEVEGYQSETGSYQISVGESEDDHGNLAVDATDLGVLSTDVVFVSGEITEYDEDWFSFTAEANRYYEFETAFVGGLDGLEDTQLQLFDEAGEVLLAANDDHRDRELSKIIWQAPTDGEFRIQVTGYLDGGGQYDLEYRLLDPPPVDDIGSFASAADTMLVPQTVPGAINFESDYDLLRFEAVDGVTYLFDLQLGTLEDSVLRVLGNDGQTILAENDDASSEDLSSVIEWTAPESLPYFIQASGFDGNLGSYRLHSSVVGDLNADGTLDSDDLSTLQQAIRDGSDRLLFDLDSNNKVDDQDVDFLIRDVFGTVRGDTDLNGAVDFADFLALSSRYGEGGGWGDGDFSGNGLVDFEDFLVLSRNFGTNNEPSEFVSQFDQLARVLATEAKRERIKNRLQVNPK